MLYEVITNMKLMQEKDRLVDLLKDYFTEGKVLPKGESFESLNNKILEIEKNILNWAKWLKIHTILQNIEATNKRVFEVMEMLDWRDIPVLFHTWETNYCDKNVITSYSIHYTKLYDYIRKFKIFIFV